MAHQLLMMSFPIPVKSLLFASSLKKLLSLGRAFPFSPLKELPPWDMCPQAEGYLTILITACLSASVEQSILNLLFDFFLINNYNNIICSIHAQRVL